MLAATATYLRAFTLLLLEGDEHVSVHLERTGEPIHRLKCWSYFGASAPG
jgi:hypothetical protein